MYRVPRPDGSFLSEISPLIAAAAPATEEPMSEDEAAEDEEDEEDDEDVARMIQLVRAAYKYLRANVDMEKFHKSVGYQLVLAQLKGWTGRVLQGFKWKRDSPELLLFFLALAIQIGKQKYNTLHGPGQPRSDGGRSVFSLENTVLVAPTYETLTAYIPRTTEKPGFATEANCAELEEQAAEDGRPTEGRAARNRRRAHQAHAGLLQAHQAIPRTCRWAATEQGGDQQLHAS
jgi:hypothetical protein